MGIPAGESRNNAVPNGNIANLNQECMHSSLNAQPKEMSTSPEPLAVVGLALKFPQGAHNTEAFWKLLLEKRSALTKVPEGRYNADAFVSLLAKHIAVFLLLTVALTGRCP